MTLRSRLFAGVTPRGLRGRVAATFGLGALLVAGTLALSTFLFSRAYLYDQRERTVVRQAALDAVFVADQIDNADADIPDVLATAGTPGSGTVVVHVRGEWYSSELGVGQEVVPQSLIDRVRSGRPAKVTVVQDGLSTVVVGIPLPHAGAEFYRVVPLRELRETLRVLQLVLATGAVAAAGGGIALGMWASRRLVQPLNLVAATAAQIAGGMLDSRLPPTRDPDLATIVGSFNAMVDTLRQRIERDSRFAADVSHELRSPLTTLVAAVDVLERRRADLPERSQLALDLVTAELDRFHTLLESLLALSRTEAGLDPKQLTALPVGELLDQAVRRAGLPSSVIEGALNARVLGDRELLERAFFNLVDNAQRHGQGLTGITVEPFSDRVAVFFDDQGPGVPPSERDRIFERFATNRAARGSSSGTGLGLALVAESVHAHGGAVWCTDNGGIGARFVVSLPRSRSTS